MQGNKQSLGDDGAGDDCMGKAIKYGALGVYGWWCAITRTIVRCVHFSWICRSTD